MCRGEGCRPCNITSHDFEQHAKQVRMKAEESENSVWVPILTIKSSSCHISLPPRPSCLYATLSTQKLCDFLKKQINSDSSFAQHPSLPLHWSQKKNLCCGDASSGFSGTSQSSPRAPSPLPAAPLPASLLPPRPCLVQSQTHPIFTRKACQKPSSCPPIPEVPLAVPGLQCSF